MFKKLLALISLCLLLGTISFAGTELVNADPFVMYDGNVYYTDSFELTSTDRWVNGGGYDLSSYYNIRYRTASWKGGATLHVDTQRLINGRWKTVNRKTTNMDKFETASIGRGLYDSTTQPTTPGTYRLKLSSFGEKIQINGFTLYRKSY